MAIASGSWVELADEFEELLVLDGTSEILPEDEKFLQSQKLFWILNKIDELLPMISDEIIQWTWFRDSNNLGPLTSADFSDEKDRVGNILKNTKERQLKKLQDNLLEIEKILPRLED